MKGSSSDDSILQRIQELSPSDLMWGSRPEWVMSPEIGAMVPGARFAGRAVTVQTRNSVRPVLSLLDASGTDDVMVIDAGSDPRAMLGDMVCRTAARKGVRAIVIDGAVRDIAGVRDIGFPLFARSPSIAVADIDPGLDYEINLPVPCGGVIVAPGDYVVGDDDGVLVIPSTKIDEVLDIAHDRVVRETRHRGNESATSLDDIGPGRTT